MLLSLKLLQAVEFNTSEREHTLKNKLAFHHDLSLRTSIHIPHTKFMALENTGKTGVKSLYWRIGRTLGVNSVFDLAVT